MLVLLIGLQNAHSQQSKLSAFLKWGGGGRNGTRGKERMESKQRSAPRELYKRRYDYSQMSSGCTEKRRSRLVSSMEINPMREDRLQYDII